VSIFFDATGGENKDNAFIDSLQMQARGTKKVPGMPLNLLVDRIDKAQFYAYEGSFTTPPCDETVTWLIIAKPQHISYQQLQYINEHWVNNATFANGNGNNRATQSLNDRKINFKSGALSLMLWSVFSVVAVVSMIV